MPLENNLLKDYGFLKDIYNDSYFPKFLVDKIKLILIDLSKEIEQNDIKSNDSLYTLSQAATIKINNLHKSFMPMIAN